MITMITLITLITLGDFNDGNQSAVYQCLTNGVLTVQTLKQEIIQNSKKASIFNPGNTGNTENTENTGKTQPRSPNEHEYQNDNDDEKGRNLNNDSPHQETSVIENVEIKTVLKKDYQHEYNLTDIYHEYASKHYKHVVHESGDIETKTSFSTNSTLSDTLLSNSTAPSSDSRDTSKESLIATTQTRDQNLSKSTILPANNFKTLDFTFSVNGFLRCVLDFMFYSSNNLKLTGVLEPYPQRERDEVILGIPRQGYPSDHLPVGGVFELVAAPADCERDPPA